MSTSVYRTFLFVGIPAAIALVATIFGSMELRHFLLNSSFFAVSEVQVLSEGVLAKDALVRRAAIPPSTNIFQLNLDEVKARVESDPWVHSATVLRALPRTIQIQYVSEKPQAILGAGSMYYLNAEGVPFYQVQKGDSLKFPFIQLEGGLKDSELLRERLQGVLGLLDLFRKSKLFAEKDLGDIVVRAESQEGAAPFLFTLRFPPASLVQNKKQNNRLYTLSFGEEEWGLQLKRWEAVVRYLAQQTKNPRLIRLELGKKVVVKVDR